MGDCYPRRSIIHIIFVLLAGACLVIQTIIATSVMSGRRNVSGVCRITWRSYPCNVKGRRSVRRGLLLLPFPASLLQCRYRWGNCHLLIRGSSRLCFIVSCVCTDFRCGRFCCQSVTAAPGTSTPVVPVTEHPRKRRRVTDPKEQELMLANFEDRWASGRSTPQPGPPSASQLPLVTPLVVSVPSLSTAVAIPATVALSSSSRSVASSSCSAKRHHYRRSPGSHPAAAPPAVASPVQRPSAHTGPVSQLFPVPFPDLSPVRRPSGHMGPTSQPFPIPSPIRKPSERTRSVSQLIPVPFPDPSPVRRPYYS